MKEIISVLQAVVGYGEYGVNWGRVHQPPFASFRTVRGNITDAEFNPVGVVEVFEDAYHLYADLTVRHASGVKRVTFDVGSFPSPKRGIAIMQTRATATEEEAVA